jgi:hypothetical protein
MLYKVRVLLKNRQRAYVRRTVFSSWQHVTADAFSLGVGLGTIREALDRADASWVRNYMPVSSVDTHSQRRWDLRVAEARIQQRMGEARHEGCWLLKQVEDQESEEVKALVEIEQPRRELEERFVRGEGSKTTTRPRREAKGDLITIPHDPEVRYGCKGGKWWVGYRLQAAETADEGLQFITHIEVVPAVPQDD